MKIEVKLDAEQIVEIVREALAVQDKVNETVRPFPVGSVIRHQSSTSARYDYKVVGYYEKYPVVEIVDEDIRYDDEIPFILPDPSIYKIAE